MQDHVTLNQPTEGDWARLSPVRLKAPEEKPSIRSWLLTVPADAISWERWARLVYSVPEAAARAFVGQAGFSRALGGILWAEICAHLPLFPFLDTDLCVFYFHWEGHSQNKPGQMMSGLEFLSVKWSLLHAFLLDVQNNR